VHAHYELTTTQSVRNDLQGLPDDPRSRLTEVLEEISGERRPCQHSKCSLLENQSDVYKVKVGEYRALLRLKKPELRVLRVGHRQNFYRGIEEPARDL
jgi:mRNA-degrading endonuclease RelE of RelBE toxin-antitoxin system